MPEETARPGFREWVDRQPEPDWVKMPLTHITQSLLAEDIIRGGQVLPEHCDVIGKPVSFFFYGRPAFRLAEGDVLKLEAACPFCFVFNSTLIDKAEEIHPFDTGAFAKRLYSHVLVEKMNLRDFSLEKDASRPNRLIAAVFASMSAYFDGDRTKIISAFEGSEAWEFHARAYIELLLSPGRNEPDDRICSIEVAISEAVPLTGNLRAVVVPHTLWAEDAKAPWLKQLQDAGVKIAPYQFIPGRHPEHYHAQLEGAVRELYRGWNLSV
jgi:hypothetical protein